MDSGELLEVPYTLENINIGEVYEIKVENIYDPSKLWVIVHFKELNVFTKYLKFWYGNEENRVKVPKFKIKKNLVCIIDRNSIFHRAIVLPLLLPDKDKVRVFLVDYGTFININVSNVYYILQKHLEVPRCALRACLVNIEPLGTYVSISLIQFKN